MKIYTKSGDDGQTGLLGGGRVSKSCPTIEALGTLDELNASMGRLHAITGADQQERLNDLARTVPPIQHHLFRLGAALADQRVPPLELKMEVPTAELEAQIDQWDQDLPPLRQFILPAGHLAACEAHSCRSICRRAERRVVELLPDQTQESTTGVPIENRRQAIRYLNRLSDFFFVYARMVHLRTGREDEFWDGQT